MYVNENEEWGGGGGGGEFNLADTCRNILVCMLVKRKGGFNLTRNAGIQTLSFKVWSTARPCIVIGIGTVSSSILLIG